MTRSRRLVVWAAIAVGLFCLGVAVLVGRDRILFHWKLEQALSGQTQLRHFPRAGGAWREEVTPERWLRERWSKVKPLLTAETRRGTRERRAGVLALLAFLQQDLGERLDLEVLWRSLVDPARRETHLAAPLEVVVRAALSDTHGGRNAALHVRGDDVKLTVCRIRGDPQNLRAEARVWDLQGEEAGRLARLIRSAVALGELSEAKAWSFWPPGPLSATVYRVAGDTIEAEPLLAARQTGAPWWDEVILRLFEAVQEPSRQPPRAPRAGDIAPQVLETLEAQLRDARQ